MTIDTMTIKEKKLKNLRKILWICFGGFSAPIILFLLPFSVLLTTAYICFAMLTPTVQHSKGFFCLQI